MEKDSFNAAIEAAAPETSLLLDKACMDLGGSDRTRVVLTGLYADLWAVFVSHLRERR